jgi:hypothetical protein
MTLIRLLRVSIATWAILTLVVCSATAAVTLPIGVARERAVSFAKSTCAHDKSCTGSGVLNCRRQTPHIVLCRIFDRRTTDVQGKFECNRLIRLALEPRSRRVPVTGVGPWNC